MYDWRVRRPIQACRKPLLRTPPKELLDGQQILTELPTGSLSCEREGGVKQGGGLVVFGTPNQ